LLATTLVPFISQITGLQAASDNEIVAEGDSLLAVDRRPHTDISDGASPDRRD